MRCFSAPISARRSRAALALVAATSVSAAASAQNLISNPSFETPVLAPGGINLYAQGTTIEAPNEWVVDASQLNAVLYENGYSAFNTPTPYGRQALYLCDNGFTGEVSQQITLEACKDYNLCFATAYISIPGQLEVWLTDPQGQTLFTQNMLISNRTFQQSCFGPIRALATGPHRLHFRQLRVTTCVIDNVQLRGTLSVSKLASAGCDAVTLRVDNAQPNTPTTWQVQTAPQSWATLSSTPVALPCGGTASASDNLPQTTLTFQRCTGDPTTPQQFVIRALITNTCGVDAADPFTYVNCPADFNCDSSVTVQDIFDFLASWFANTPRANFNQVNGVSVQDIFDFLRAWFAGC